MWSPDWTKAKIAVLTAWYLGRGAREAVWG